MRKLLSILITTILCAAVFCGCFPRSNMPFNGDVEFHGIVVTVPKSYVRDSTKSSDELWVFEQGNYDKYIMISCKAAKSEDAVKSYASFIESQGGSSEDIKLADLDAVKLTYTQDNKDTRETVFVLNDSIYAIALRGGDDAEYQELLDSFKIKASETTTTDNTTT
jgi:hypothetical protein